MPRPLDYQAIIDTADNPELTAEAAKNLLKKSAARILMVAIQKGPPAVITSLVEDKGCIPVFCRLLIEANESDEIMDYMECLDKLLSDDTSGGKAIARREEVEGAGGRDAFRRLIAHQDEPISSFAKAVCAKHWSDVVWITLNKHV